MRKTIIAFRNFANAPKKSQGRAVGAEVHYVLVDSTEKHSSNNHCSAQQPAAGINTVPG